MYFILIHVHHSFTYSFIHSFTIVKSCLKSASNLLTPLGKPLLFSEPQLSTLQMREMEQVVIAD